jgi:cysteine desulfurase
VGKPIYLDYQATTPVDPRVLDAMLPYFNEKFGNAASRTHAYGWEAEKAVELARKRIASLLGASASEIVFTSGATESNNLAIKGVPEGQVITVATEHKAVLDPVKRRGNATVLPVRPNGLLDLNQLRDAIRQDTVLVSTMHANNEIGVIQPIHEIGAICRERGVLFHCDAAQSFGKIPVDGGIDLTSVSAHKIYGPKGVGALYIRKGLRLAAQIDGGGHESGMRSGTLNVPAIVGFGEACAICEREMDAESTRLIALRDRFLAQLPDGARVNGSMEHRLAGNLNVSFEGIDAKSLLLELPQLAISTGSACTSATAEPSHVLKALGAPPSIRIGLGRFTTEDEIDRAAALIAAAVTKLRRLAPVQYI